MNLRSLAGMVLGGAVGATVGVGYEFVKEEKRLDKVEDKIAGFINKYSKKKYKRYL